MLTLQFIPRFEIEGLSSEKRINKLLRSVKQNKIVLLEGKLKSEEEAELIRRTMEEISEEFTGIELSVIRDGEIPGLFQRVKNKFMKLLLGDRFGFTIIGPAKIVQEIKQDPDKIQLMISENTKPAKKKKSKK